MRTAGLCFADATAAAVDAGFVAVWDAVTAGRCDACGAVAVAARAIACALAAAAGGAAQSARSATVDVGLTLVFCLIEAGGETGVRCCGVAGATDTVGV